MVSNSEDLPILLNKLTTQAQNTFERLPPQLRDSWKQTQEYWAQNLLTLFSAVKDNTIPIETAVTSISQYLALLSTERAIDPLTEFWNRRGITEIGDMLISQSRRERTPLTVAIFDIDHFKQFNDVFTHAVGDSVLQEISILAHSNLRDGDVLGRWGGEEFVILLPNIDSQNAETILERVRSKIETDLIEKIPKIGIDKPPITISMGFADLNLSDTLESLTDRADRALHIAKGDYIIPGISPQGRNRIMGWKPDFSNAVPAPKPIKDA